MPPVPARGVSAEGVHTRPASTPSASASHEQHASIMLAYPWPVHYIQGTKSTLFRVRLMFLHTQVSRRCTCVSTFMCTYGRPCARVVRVVHSCRGAWRSEAREGAGAALAACVGFVHWGRILGRLSSTIGRRALNGRGFRGTAHPGEITSQMLCVCAMLGQAGVRSLSGVLFGPAVSCAEGARVGPSCSRCER